MDRNKKTAEKKKQQKIHSGSRQRPRLRLPLSTVLSIGAALLLAFVGGSVLLYVSRAANEQASDIMGETGALIVGRGLEVVSDFFQTEERLGLLAAEVLSDPQVYSAPMELREQLITILSRQTNIKRISYTAPNGRRVSVQLANASAPMERTSVRPPNQKDMNKGHLQWSEPYFDERTGETYMGFAVYYLNPVDNAISRLTMEYSVALLGTIMNRIKWRASQVPFILLGKDRVLASSEQKFLNYKPTQQNPLPPLSYMEGTPLSYIWDKSHERRDLDSEYEGHVDETPHGTYLFLYDSLKGRQPIIVGSYVPAAEFSTPFDNLHKVFMLATAFLAFGVMTMFVLGRRLSYPFVALANQANALRNLSMEGLKALPRSHLKEVDEANQAFNSAGVALSAFSRYVPKDLVRALLESDFKGLNSTELREMTILFSDIAGFTGVASKLTAEETTALLNTHFQQLADCISKTGGTIDKYIGDGCMAFWGAPQIMENHAQAAIDAVHLIARRLERELHDEEGVIDQPRLRIGVHTGTVVVGNIGAVERLNYTVVGDAVNVAARLEELGKKVAPDAKVVALASGATVQQLSNKSSAELLGDYKLRGRDDAVDVYRIV